MEKPRSITLESQKPEEALQPLAVALLESAQWRRLNGIEDKTPEVAEQLATEQAKRAEQLVLSLRKHSSSEDRQRMTSEQLTNPESRLYKDARAAIYIQEVNTQTQKNKGLAGASKLPVSGKLPESEQRRLLLPIEYALQAAAKTINREYKQRKDETNRSAAGMGRAAVIVTGPTSSSDKSQWILGA